MKMTNFPMDFNFDRSNAEAVMGRLDFYISTDWGETWQYLGIFDDEGSLEVTKELFEYDNDGKPFISVYTKEKFQIKGSLLNTSNPYARALAFGRDPAADVKTVETTTPAGTPGEAFELDMSTPRAVPPFFALRAVGKTHAGKDFAHEFCKAQVTTASISEAFNNKDLSKLPVEMTAFADPDENMGFSLYRYQVEK